MADAAKKAKLTKVQLLCTYSDGKDNPGPGAVIEVDEDEALRLKDLRAAKDPDAPAAAE
ncbi:MAG: hypothetical protein V4720_06160 [Pseudomonadota bacterium]